MNNIKLKDIEFDLRFPRPEKTLQRKCVIWLFLMITFLWLLTKFPDSSLYPSLLLMFGISGLCALLLLAVVSVFLLEGSFVATSILFSVIYSALSLLSWWDGEFVLAFSSIILGLFTALYLLGIEMLTLSSSRAIYVNVLIITALWSIALPLFLIVFLFL